MRKLLLALLFICCYVTVNAQEKDKKLLNVKGKVLDKETNLPLEYATVIFNDSATETTLFGAITNKKGEFNLEVSKGKYNIRLEYLSYKTIHLNLKSIESNLNLGTFQLETDSELLNDIEITAEKRNLEFQQNKLVVNVAKDISAASSMTMDILNNIPSVTVVNDNIQIRGQNATVMINGRTSSMSKTEALKTLPANSIERIEVISNPGAQYRASYRSIVNIILKKERDEGLNASLTGSIGYKDIYGGLISLNYKTKNVNFFTNTSYFQNNPIQLSDAQNEYYTNGVTTSFLNEKSEFNSNRNGLITTTGFDFYLSKSTTLTTSLNYTDLSYKNKTLTISDIFNPTKAPISTNNRNHTGSFDDEIIEFVTTFEHLFKKEGQKLSSSFTHTLDTETHHNNITNSNSSYTSENYFEENILKNTIVNGTFTNPLSQKATLTIGYEGEFGEIPFRYSSLGIQNNIDFNEDLHSAFATFEHLGDKISYELGLRAEFSEYNIEYLTLNISQNKNFNDLFPSAYLEYTIKDNQSTSIGYSRKIWRPAYEELQPFEQKYSETSSFIGNVDLNPMYEDKFSLDYAFFGEKITIIPSLFYDKYNDYMQEAIYETGEQINGVKKIIKTPVNVGDANLYGLNLTTTLKASKNLDFTFNSMFYNFDQKGIFETTNLLNEPIVLDYNQKSFNGNLSLLTQLKIPNTINFQTNIIHFLESEGPYSIRKAYTYASATISKDLFDKNATISLTTNDIFNSNKTKRDRFDNNYFSKSVIENKYQNIILSFTYRFNQSKKDRKIDFDKKDYKPNY